MENEQISERIQLHHQIIVYAEHRNREEMVDSAETTYEQIAADCALQALAKQNARSQYAKGKESVNPTAPTKGALRDATVQSATPSQEAKARYCALDRALAAKMDEY